jgi:excisionase family DNA binding protein
MAAEGTSHADRMRAVLQDNLRQSEAALAKLPPSPEPGFHAATAAEDVAARIERLNARWDLEHARYACEEFEQDADAYEAEQREDERRERKPIPDDPNGLLTLAQAAAHLGTTIDQVRAHVADGALRFVNIGRGRKRPRYRFEHTDLDAFKASRIQEHSTCRSTDGRGPNFSRSISSSNVIGFQDARAARRSAKPKRSKQ